MSDSDPQDKLHPIAQTIARCLEVDSKGKLRLRVGPVKKAFAECQSDPKALRWAALTLVDCARRSEEAHAKGVAKQLLDIAVTAAQILGEDNKRHARKSGDREKEVQKRAMALTGRKQSPVRPLATGEAPPRDTVAAGLLVQAQRRILR